VIGPVLFTLVAFIAGATRSGYSAWHAYVSMLSLGEGGWVMAANLVVSGLLLVAFAMGLRRRGYGWPSILIGAAGAGLAIQGVFPADPGLGYPPGAPDGVPAVMSTSSGIHYLAGSIAGLANATAAVLMARRFGRDSSAAGWSRYLAVTAALVFGLLVALGFAGSDGPVLQGLAGAIQRVWIVVALTWLVLLAVRLLGTGGVVTAEA
jgi:uncharacterized protein DUF998